AATFKPQSLSPALLNGPGPPMLRSAAAQAGLRLLLRDFVYVIRMVKARAAFALKLAGADGKPEAVATPRPGRVDSFMTFLYLALGETVRLTSPVSYPFLWGARGLPRFHWDNNTNSLMLRNIGQAIGVGAVFDPTHADSTVLPRDIHALESLMARMDAP